jgi:4-hydroxythreonine-4-phosphate dehydrogenase
MRKSAAVARVVLPRIAISMGDPGGIGPEVALKALCDREVLRACQPVLVGDVRFLRNLAGLLHLPARVEPLRSRGTATPMVSAAATRRGKVISLREVKIVPLTISAHDATRVSKSAPLGRASKAGGKAAGGAVVEAVKLAMAGRVDGVVTAPVSKESLALAGYGLVGHTELIAKLTGIKKYAMMMTNEDLRVVFASTHVPLRQAARSVTVKNLLEKFTLAKEYLRLFLGFDAATIGVCCLNPHCGEGGLLSREEEAVIGPAIDLGRKRGINVEGPYPADAIFQTPLSKGFDVIIAMYHDQGMIPIKMGHHSRVLNVTLGIPFVRTSPGHGTAFDIAGEGCASAGGMVNAILECAKMIEQLKLRKRRERR